jgi:hypothetical protein
MLGQHTGDVLATWLGLSHADIEALTADKIV